MNSNAALSFRRLKEVAVLVDAASRTGDGASAAPLLRAVAPAVAAACASRCGAESADVAAGAQHVRPSLSGPVRSVSLSVKSVSGTGASCHRNQTPAVGEQHPCAAFGFNLLSSLSLSLCSAYVFC